MTPFRWTRKGIVTSFTTGEAALLRDLAGQLIELLSDRSAEVSPAQPDAADALLAQLGIGGGTRAPLDPAVARLLPDAYREDADAASEHRHLTERSLIDRKLANARSVIASLERRSVLLGPSQVQSWLRNLTDLRLTIAARLEIEEDGDEGHLETDSDFALHAAYDWLGYLQGALVDVIDS